MFKVIIYGFSSPGESQAPDSENISVDFTGAGAYEGNEAGAVIPPYPALQGSPLGILIKLTVGPQNFHTGICQPVRQLR